MDTNAIPIYIVVDFDGDIYGTHLVREEAVKYIYAIAKYQDRTVTIERDPEIYRLCKIGESITSSFMMWIEVRYLNTLSFLHIPS